MTGKNDSDNTAREILELAGLVKDMTEAEIAALVEVAEERLYTSGTAIVLEDSKSRDFFVIKSGRASVRLSLPSDFGKDEIVFMMRDGQIFGEFSLVDGSPRSATIKAEDDVSAYRFDFDYLTRLLDAQPRIGYILMRNIAAIISTRVRNTNMLWRNSLMW